MEAKLAKFEVKDLPDLCIIGKEIVGKMEDLGENNPIPAFWGKCFEENIFETLEKTLSENIYDPAYVGYMFSLNSSEFVNVCGILMKPDTKVLDGFVKYDIKKCTIGIGWIQGKEPDIFMAAHVLTEQAFKDAGYKYDDSKSFSMEVYVCERFNTTDENGNKILDYYIPIKKNE